MSTSVPIPDQVSRHPAKWRAIWRRRWHLASVAGLSSLLLLALLATSGGRAGQRCAHAFEARARHIE